MAQINFPILNTPDKNLQLIQANIQKALAQIQQSPFQGGNYLTNIALSAGSNKINHSLGRQPVIWVLGDINAASTLYRSAWDATTITLVASATATIALWVN